jgi:hypothetical protein
MAYEDVKYVMQLRQRLKQKRQELSEILIKKGYFCNDELIASLYYYAGVFDANFLWVKNLEEYKTKLDLIKLSGEERRVFSQLYLAGYEYSKLHERFQIESVPESNIRNSLVPNSAPSSGSWYLTRWGLREQYPHSMCMRTRIEDNTDSSMVWLLIA